jgi:hypothetical protein
MLAVTLLASVLHLLFEFLAFQSDIAFWSNNTSLAGLSTRSLIADLASQFVVVLFLVDSNTSLLVTIPAAIGVVIQMWKVSPRYGVELFQSYLISYLLQYYSCMYRFKRPLDLLLIRRS